MGPWYNMGMQKTRTVRSVFVRRLLKIHALAFTTALGVYFVLAFFDPGLLSYDLRQKFHALADETVTITATVLGPPIQPVVTATADCDESTGTLSVTLDWADDANTDTYDIERDSAPLVSGLSNSAYSDTNVVIATTYEYVATANGPMGPGVAVSASVSVTTPDACDITLAPPAVTIVSFNGRGVDGYDGIPRVENRRPLFSGTTSMANATILVTIGNSFIAQLGANANGYWEWRPPQNISSGGHLFTVTATDPNDDTRHATATLRFDTLKNSGTGGSQNITKSSVESPAIASNGMPIQISLAVKNPDYSVLQGENLQVFLTIKSLIEKYTHITIPIRYTIMDERYDLIFSQVENVYITHGVVVHQTVSIPSYMVPKNYFIQAELLLDEMSVSRIAPFSVIELPLMHFVSGITVSYQDVIHYLGWIVFVFVFVLLFWAYLFIREYMLYLQGDGEVTEYDLMKAGYFRN